MLGLLGTIDEARIYNQALNPTEISFLADFETLEAQASNQSLQLSPPVAQFKLDRVAPKSG